MADTVIERMAEAFCRAIEAQTRLHAAPSRIYRDAGDFRDVQISGQVDVLDAMKAALMVMREPIDAMVKAGAAQEVTFSADGNSYIGKIAVEYSSDRDKGADTLFRAMIDAALAEEAPPA